MLRTLNTLLAIRISITANLLIYYIQKLPLIGKLVRDSFYGNLDFKKIITVIALLFTQLWGVMLRFIYLGMLIYLPVIGLGEGLSEEDQLKQFVHIFTVISFVVAAVSSASVLEPKREKYVAVKLMRLSGARYMQASLGYRYVTFMVYLLPAMLVFGTLLGASIIEAVLLTILITLWRILVEYAHLKLFEKTGVVLIKHTALVWSVILLGYAAAYLPLLLGKVLSTDSFLLSLPASIVITAGGLFAAIRLARYSDYRAVVDAATKRDDPLLDLGRMMTEAQKKSVKSKDSDYTVNLNEQDKLKTKEGYGYLNALFFLRHRSLISSPINKRLAIIGAFGVVGVILMILFREQLEDQKWSLEKIFPFLILIMYFMSIGENICKAIFYNCDLSLMRYSFYRSAVYEHFLIRLRRVMSLNLGIAAALGVSLTAITAAAGEEWLSTELLMLWVCVISLSAFFSVHHLFMYYIFQPYSTELNMKNPLYFIVNMVVSFAGGISIILRVPAVSFTVIIFAVTLIYLAVALILVRKYGARTFRVK
ncbi:hypothetical protein FHS15_002861 [Paenibacillus castaneae]|uniref:hypothetical protein n=1 Tax=Paenibacillus castaneae TaxID=474957 RepID=UPI000C9C84C3|nr:hypothetical protein [Paenibacillus castaneae]NIK77723.1 hypothetical protein [Paenibacillus castaneae]